MSLKRKKEDEIYKLLMSQITATIGEQESEARFVVRIGYATNQLIGKYNIAEHNTYQGLQHGRLNHIFELARVLCPTRLEPIMQKCKPAAAGMVLAPRKSFEKHGRGRKSSCLGAQTSARELALAKPLKPSKKFAMKSSRRSPTEKASTSGVEAASKKMFSTSTGRSSTTRALKHALNLVGSDSSASDGETAPLERPSKRSKETPLAMDITKSSTLKGFFD
jgi:hypothetical protein